MASIGRRQGKAISFRRNEIIYSAGNASSLANASAPGALTEGTFPAAIDATWSEVQATISQYGGLDLAVRKLVKFTQRPMPLLVAA